MEEKTVTISMERFENLLQAETLLEVIKKRIREKDMFGPSEDKKYIANLLDMELETERKDENTFV